MQPQDAEIIIQRNGVSVSGFHLSVTVRAFRPSNQAEEGVSYVIETEDELLNKSSITASSETLALLLGRQQELLHPDKESLLAEALVGCLRYEHDKTDRRKKRLVLVTVEADQGERGVVEKRRKTSRLTTVTGSTKRAAMIAGPEQVSEAVKTEEKSRLLPQRGPDAIVVKVLLGLSHTISVYEEEDGTVLLRTRDENFLDRELALSPNDVSTHLRLVPRTLSKQQRLENLIECLELRHDRRDKRKMFLKLREHEEPIERKRSQKTTLKASVSLKAKMDDVCGGNSKVAQDPSATTVDSDVHEVTKRRIARGRKDRKHVRNHWAKRSTQRASQRTSNANSNAGGARSRHYAAVKLQSVARGRAGRIGLRKRRNDVRQRAVTSTKALIPTRNLAELRAAPVVKLQSMEYERQERKLATTRRSNEIHKSPLKRIATNADSAAAIKLQSLARGHAGRRTAAACRPRIQTACLPQNFAADDKAIYTAGVVNGGFETAPITKTLSETEQKRHQLSSVNRNEMALESLQNRLPRTKYALDPSFLVSVSLATAAATTHSAADPAHTKPRPLPETLTRISRLGYPAGAAEFIAGWRSRMNLLQNQFSNRLLIGKIASEVRTAHPFLPMEVLYCALVGNECRVNEAVARLADPVFVAECNSVCKVFDFTAFVESHGEAIVSPRRATKHTLGTGRYNSLRAGVADRFARKRTKGGSVGARSKRLDPISVGSAYRFRTLHSSEFGAGTHGAQRSSITRSCSPGGKSSNGVSSPQSLSCAVKSTAAPTETVAMIVQNIDGMKRKTNLRVSPMGEGRVEDGISSPKEMAAVSPVEWRQRSEQCRSKRRQTPSHGFDAVYARVLLRRTESLTARTHDVRFSQQKVSQQKSAMRLPPRCGVMQVLVRPESRAFGRRVDWASTNT